jgi:hypothetical protein
MILEPANAEFVPQRFLAGLVRCARAIREIPELDDSKYDPVTLCGNQLGKMPHADSRGMKTAGAVNGKRPHSQYEDIRHGKIQMR